MHKNFGYAEANPDADIKGIDACRKICILSSSAYGIYVEPNNISVEGIENITLDQIEKASNLGYVIKLIGYSKKISDSEIEIFVAPCAIKKTHPLANVNDVYNAILLNGDMVGNVMFYGKGAGKFPTASAVCSDILECLDKNKENEIIWNSKDVILKKPELKYLEEVDIPLIE